MHEYQYFICPVVSINTLGLENYKVKNVTKFASKQIFIKIL